MIEFIEQDSEPVATRIQPSLKIRGDGTLALVFFNTGRGYGKAVLEISPTGFVTFLDATKLGIEMADKFGFLRSGPEAPGGLGME